MVLLDIMVRGCVRGCVEELCWLFFVHIIFIFSQRANSRKVKHKNYFVYPLCTHV
jgi:hypothetical protein